MRFIVYGAGGLGGVVGAQLLQADREGVLVARGEHLAAMQRDGLRYETPFGDERLAVPAVGHVGEIAPRPDDVVVLTCKSQHTRAALDALRAARGDRVPVVCAQNGVANERTALRRFAAVYAMLVHLPAQLIEPGRIQCHARLAPGILDLGCYPGGADDRAGAIAGHLEAAGFSARPDPRVMRLKYAKLLVNLDNALDAVAPAGPAARGIRAALRAEGEACLRAAGIDHASAEALRARRAGVFELGAIPGAERVGGSSRQSLLRGTGDIEADFLNGEIVLLGRMHGVPTPANAVLQRRAVELARRRAAPGSVPLDALAGDIAAEARRAG